MHVEGVLANNDYILNGCYIEITSNCNLRCIHCYNESGELRDQISVEAFTVDMWNDAVNYIAGQSPLSEALHAKYILVKCWEKHKNTS